jgi:hypothetical protein
MVKANKLEEQELYALIFEPFENACNHDLGSMYYAVKLAKLAVKLLKNKELDEKDELLLKKAGVYNTYLQEKKSYHHKSDLDKMEKTAAVPFLTSILRTVLSPVGSLFAGAASIVTLSLFLVPLLATAATGLFGGAALGYLLPTNIDEAGTEDIKGYLRNKIQANQLRILREQLGKSRKVREQIEEIEKDMGYG